MPYTKPPEVTPDDIRREADKFEVEMAVRDFFEQNPFQDAREFSAGKIFE